MQKNELRVPLIKAGMVVGAISFFILFGLGAPHDSGFWGTVGAGFSGFFGTIKLIVGLTLSFALLFFSCIFLFIGYKTFVLKEKGWGDKLIEKMPFLFESALFKKITGVTERVERQYIDKRIGSIEKNQEKLTEQISAMKSQLHRCQLKADTAAPGELLSKIEDEMSNLTGKVAELQKTDEADSGDLLGKMDDKMSSLTEKVAELQKTIETVPDELLGKIENEMSSLTKKVAELQKTDKADPGEILGKMEDEMSSLTGKVEAFRKTVGIVQDDLSVMRDNMEDTATPETLSEKSDVEDLKKSEHRIFTFIEDDKNRDDFIKHVKETVDQGLSYTKAIDYLVENSSKIIAEVIASHPSLTRDYIKICR